MKGGPRGRYTRGLREEAVRLIAEEKLEVPEAGRRLSLPPSTSGHWVKAHRSGKLGDGGKTYRPMTEIETELAGTKMELAEVKLKRGIPKKAAA